MKVRINFPQPPNHHSHHSLGHTICKEISRAGFEPNHKKDEEGHSIEVQLLPEKLPTVMDIVRHRGCTLSVLEQK